MPETWDAGNLCAEHIGRTIRVLVVDDVLEITTVITVELRQIDHNAAETTLLLGTGAEKEVTLDHDYSMILDPVADYSDMHRLIP